MTLVRDSNLSLGATSTARTSTAVVIGCVLHNVSSFDVLIHRCIRVRVCAYGLFGSRYEFLELFLESFYLLRVQRLLVGYPVAHKI
jgi:hypothetical protein